MMRMKMPQLSEVCTVACYIVLPVAAALLCVTLSVVAARWWSTVSLGEVDVLVELPDQEPQLVHARDVVVLGDRVFLTSDWAKGDEPKVPRRWSLQSDRCYTLPLSSVRPRPQVTGPTPPSALGPVGFSGRPASVTGPGR